LQAEAAAAAVSPAADVSFADLAVALAMKEAVGLLSPTSLPLLLLLPLP
jgi:hypothetical protein